MEFRSWGVSLYSILGWTLMDANHSMQHADRNCYGGNVGKSMKVVELVVAQKGLFSRYRHDTSKSQLA